MALGLPQARFGLTELLKANCISGCTEIMNRRLYTGIGGYSEHINIHDHWAALYAAGCGVIRSVPMALMLYRQHADNVIGAGVITRKGGGHSLSGLFRVMSKLKLILQPKQFFQRLSVSKQRFYKASEPFMFFRSRYSSAMKTDKLHELNAFLKLWEGSRLERLAVFFRIGFPHIRRLQYKAKMFIKLLVY